MKKNYEILDHTADISVKIKAASLRGIFIESSVAMMDLICKIEKVKALKSFNINVSGISNEQLLVNWLQELLFLHEVKNFLFSKFTIKSLKNGLLTGSATGEKLDSSRHELLNHIKAVTYNNLEITKDNGNFVTRITFDI